MLTEFTWKHRRIQISQKRHSFSVAIDGVSIYSFDLEGRFLGAFVEGKNYVRGLSGKLLEKQGVYEDGLKGRLRREVVNPEKRAFLERIYEQVIALARALQAKAIAGIPPDRQEALGALLGQIYSPDQLEADVQRFQKIYKPISILPPDQYLSVVLQVTEGCSYNRCTFCHFYRDRPFRIKSDEEVRRHIREVKTFLGRSILLRKSIFLADANAIVIPQRRLLPILEQVHEAFPIRSPGGKRSQDIAVPSFDGIYSFMDMFEGRHKSEVDFAELAARGLRRVYIGLETGSDALLRFLRKAGNAQDAVAAVRALKAAGVQVGVIVMLGVGGDRYAEEHVRATQRVLNAMHLGAGDILYTSEFVEYPDLEYATLARKAGIRPLTRREMVAQRRRILEGLRFSDADRPRTSNYDIREFIY